MKGFARRIAVVVGTVAMSIGLLTVTAPAASAAADNAPQSRDTGWGP